MSCYCGGRIQRIPQIPGQNPNDRSRHCERGEFVLRRMRGAKQSGVGGAWSRPGQWPDLARLPRPDFVGARNDGGVSGESRGLPSGRGYGGCAPNIQTNHPRAGGREKPRGGVGRPAKRIPRRTRNDRGVAPYHGCRRPLYLSTKNSMRNPSGSSRKILRLPSSSSRNAGLMPAFSISASALSKPSSPAISKLNWRSPSPCPSST